MAIEIAATRTQSRRSQARVNLPRSLGDANRSYTDTKPALAG
jgi:hypothetical protein